MAGMVDEEMATSGGSWQRPSLDSTYGEVHAMHVEQSPVENVAQYCTKRSKSRTYRGSLLANIIPMQKAPEVAVTNVVPKGHAARQEPR